MNYDDFISSKATGCAPVGFDPQSENNHLMHFQSDIVTWATRRGRAAIFADCGMGKTIMQLSWADNVAAHTGKAVLILAPLAVAQQTVEEGVKFGIAARYLRADDGNTGIVVTNYEMMDHFELSRFGGIVLDESSILKSKTGKTRTAIIAAFQDTPYRLACTATPAPNDHIELGNHAAFLGIMSPAEMLATYFVHDGGSTQNWRLKGHARGDFWRWVCSWAIMIQKPSDIGHSDEGFSLPPLVVDQITVNSDATPGYLFSMVAESMGDRITARRESIPQRVRACADVVNSTSGQWIVWCGLNDESKQLSDSINGAVSISGSDPTDLKESRMAGFSRGDFRVLVTKPKICGFGMNWQHCSNVAFVGLSDSWESYYQAVRRCWRFGQQSSVNVKIITASTEGAVVANIQSKEAAAKAMVDGMLSEMLDITRENIGGSSRSFINYNPSLTMEVPAWLTS